jgi:hypothetical protein
MALPSKVPVAGQSPHCVDENQAARRRAKYTTIDAEMNMPDSLQS